MSHFEDFNACRAYLRANANPAARRIARSMTTARRAATLCNARAARAAAERIARNRAYLSTAHTITQEAAAYAEEHARDCAASITLPAFPF